MGDDGEFPEGDDSMHEELGNENIHSHSVNGVNDNSAVGPSLEPSFGGRRDNDVGPFPFGCGVGSASFGLGGLSSDRSPGPSRRARLGFRHRKGQAHEGKSYSPEEARPKKRTRQEVEVNEEGFGFVGFADSSKKTPENSIHIEDPNYVGIDLNVGTGIGDAEGVDRGEAGSGSSDNGSLVAWSSAAESFRIG
ncbi:hypothetical protein Hanom_Chr12g01150551 [Helianthus anomalus]